MTASAGCLGGAAGTALTESESANCSYEAVELVLGFENGFAGMSMALFVLAMEAG